jgi:hypothetical protein
MIQPPTRIKAIILAGRVVMQNREGWNMMVFVNENIT